MSFLRSFQLGADAAETGIQAYDRSRSWADKLTERGEAKEAARAARELKAGNREEDRTDKIYAVSGDRQWRSNEAALDRRDRGLDRAQRAKR